jgi:hypothetical protein
MALTNKARWRERHLVRRRDAQRVANLLTRKNWPDGHVEEIAAALQGFFSTAGIAQLRRALKPKTSDEMKAKNRELQARWQALWLKDHPGKTAADYRRLSSEEEWEWRGAKSRAWIAAEDADYARDHSGQKMPEHECNLTDREWSDLTRWRRQRDRRLAR